MHQRKGQEIEDRCGVQPTVQHDGRGFELEDIARQCRMTRQTILKDTKGKPLDTQNYNCANNSFVVSSIYQHQINQRTPYLSFSRDNIHYIVYIA